MEQRLSVGDEETQFHFVVVLDEYGTKYAYIENYETDGKHTSNFTLFGVDEGLGKNMNRQITKVVKELRDWV